LCQIPQFANSGYIGAPLGLFNTTYFYIKLGLTTLLFKKPMEFHDYIGVIIIRGGTRKNNQRWQLIRRPTRETCRACRVAMGTCSPAPNWSWRTGGSAQFQGRKMQTCGEARYKKSRHKPDTNRNTQKQEVTNLEESTRSVKNASTRMRTPYPEIPTQRPRTKIPAVYTITYLTTDITNTPTRKNTRDTAQRMTEIAPMSRGSSPTGAPPTSCTDKVA